MNNEFLFLLHTFLIGSTALICLKLGSQALVAFMVTQAIIANLFVLKQITLFGWNATAADVYIIGSVLGINLLQEYFGKTLARKAIWISFLLLVFYTIVSQFQLWYQPSRQDFAHQHFSTLLHFMPRITLASIVVYLLVQHIDSYTYAFMQKIWGKKWLITRNIITISFSQLLDTLLFGMLGLYGIIPHILEVMVVSYTIKMCMLFLISPFIGLTRKIAEPF